MSYKFGINTNYCFGLLHKCAFIVDHPFQFATVLSQVLIIFTLLIFCIKFLKFQIGFRPDAAKLNVLETNKNYPSLQDYCMIF